MDLVLIRILIYSFICILCIILAMIIINKLYISKKFSKQNHFHFYNDLFSWEMFYIFIGIESCLKIISFFLLSNNLISYILLRARILIYFFPFWTKIIHLEKVMDKITYERHYYAGIIPLIITLVLAFTNISNLILILIFLFTTFSLFLILFIFFKNTGTKRSKTLKIIFGTLILGVGYLFKPEILEGYIGISEILEILIILSDIVVPILFIIGLLLIYDSYRKEL